MILMNVTMEKIRTMVEKLDTLRYADCSGVENLQYAPTAYKSGNSVPTDIEFVPYDTETHLRGKDAHFWFTGKIKTPPKNDRLTPVFSVITGAEGLWDPTNPQCTVFLDGKTYCTMDTNHTVMYLEPDKEYDLAVYFYMGMLDETCVQFKPSVKTLDVPTNKLYYDIKVPYEALLCLDENSGDYVKMLNCLDEALINLDLRYPLSEEYYASIDKTCAALDESLGKLCGKSDVTVSCIGHTHIDVAWLWTLAQTREKAQRSFSTVLRYMEKYPDYIFMSSQPQLYEYVKEDDPELYERIKERIAEGRWEADGAMWLEADTNLASGESLIRQIMFGKKFFMDEFGIDSRTLWLPDVFGYSAALPQILKKTGVDRFFTSKLEWNDTNRIPHDIFMWEGIDGTEIFACKIKDYVRKLDARMMYDSWQLFSDKRYSDTVLSTFGFGDGGGGPTEQMLEEYERLKKGLPGMPNVKIEKTSEYFKKVEADFEENCKKLKKTPKWVGELYLEMHRGTYTSIAKNKRNNRKSELLFQSAEAASAMCVALLGAEYPQREINGSWKTILLNQFHDIIPGSSIFEVYEESDRQYAEIAEVGNRIYGGMTKLIAENISTDGGVLVYNPNPFESDGCVNIDGKYIYAGKVPSLGWTVINPDETVNDVPRVSGNIAENNLVRIEIDSGGELVSVYDKEADREAIADGMSANRLEVYEDYPNVYDAWELCSYYKQKMWTVDDVLSIEAYNAGVRAGFIVKKKYCTSTIEQKILLSPNSKRIDFETEIDWSEDHVLLKAAFPCNVHSDKVTYEIQFGAIERPNHTNTSWDEAKFEVCAHKWADVSEYGYGVSILNDCKYGYSAEGSTLKLSLLKCATYPNPRADRGHHSFVYSMYPHIGGWREGGTVREAYRLNKPLCAVETESHGGVLPQSYSFMSCDSENIVIDTVKKAEDDSSIIVRLYDAFDAHTSARIKVGVPIEEAYICDNLENEIEKARVENDEVYIDVSNYEIMTLKLKIAE